MKVILIATSKFGSPVSNYYKALANEFLKSKYHVVFIFDGQIKDLPLDTEHCSYYTWPSKRPTKIQDFVFLHKVIKRHQPIVSISNFGSTNLVTLTSFINGVKFRINYVHTITSLFNRDIQDNKLKTKFLFLRKKLIYGLCTHFFTNSNGNKEDFIKNFKEKRSKIYVFPLLIEASKIPYVAMSQRHLNQVLIVGALIPWKDHEALLYQFKFCIQQGLDLILKIVGTGVLLEKLKKTVTDLELETNVVFCGYVNNNVIGEYFSKCFLHIVSAKQDAYGVVHIEALKEGTPIVSTKTAGALDILQPGVNGEFFDHEKPGSLFTAITKIQSNWDFYSANAIDSFNTNYEMVNNIKSHASKILNLIS
ncbi:glycosyltransferase [Oceanihabitans sediminis]|uniref:glycosyltransferase n=1 Tax=Oceanihabitans sediminis TaxID=1812012 RepID=UPI003A93557F